MTISHNSISGLVREDELDAGQRAPQYGIDQLYDNDRMLMHVVLCRGVLNVSIPSKCRTQNVARLQCIHVQTV